MLKVSEEGETLPECFGKSFDRNAIECVGGHDPVQGGMREACGAQSRCSVRSQAGRHGAETAAAIVPINHLVHRPPVTTFVPPAVRPAQPVYGGSQPHGYSPAAGIQQMVPVNYGMPQYLSVREPADGRGLAMRLGVELLRSLGKAMGHTFANFLDSEVFTRRG